jgi:hypothetical protein
MSRTHRTIPPRSGYSALLRRPRHRHKLLAGESKKTVVTDNDEKAVAAIKEAGHQLAFLLGTLTPIQRRRFHRLAVKESIGKITNIELNELNALDNKR